MSRRQRFLVKASRKKAAWSRARGEGSSQSSTEDVMSGRVGGAELGWVGVKSSCKSYSDKADSEDHAVAAALVLLFAFRLRRWWTFLFLEFPVEWQMEGKTHYTPGDICKAGELEAEAEGRFGISLKPWTVSATPGGERSFSSISHLITLTSSWKAWSTFMRILAEASIYVTFSCLASCWPSSWVT